jgi:hypothetical protein
MGIFRLEVMYKAGELGSEHVNQILTLCRFLHEGFYTPYLPFMTRMLGLGLL